MRAQPRERGVVDSSPYVSLCRRLISAERQMFPTTIASSQDDPMMASPYRLDPSLLQLAEARQVLAAMGSDYAGLNRQLDELLSRLQEGRIRLAVLGQFKRGKSSLLNALVGEPLLPTGILPVTAVPTIIRYGERRRVRIAKLDGRDEEHAGTLEALADVLIRAVTEEKNPANRLGIAHVEVEHPSPFLAKGVEIIDTPGIGSTLHHNTQTARATLPRCDVAIFIVSPDPPITDVEVQFLRAVKDATAGVIFVMAKADLLAPAERSDAVSFLQQVLHEQTGFSNCERIFLVSARQALESRSHGAAAMRAESGMEELETYLADFLATEKHAVLRQAVRAKAARLIGEALFIIELERKAIELPRQELERRSELLDPQLSKIELERMYLTDRLAGDRQRLSREMDQLANAMVQPAKKALTACIEQVRDGAGSDITLLDLERNMRSALKGEVERIFRDAARDLMAAAGERFQSIQDLHCHEMEIMIGRVRRTAADLFEVPCLEGAPLDRLEHIRKPRVVPQRWISSFLEEAASWFRIFLPHGLRARRLEQRVQKDIDYLVIRNIEDLRWATIKNLEEAFQNFQVRLEAQIDTVIRAIRSSIRSALTRQIARESRRASELERLEGLRLRLTQILAILSPQAAGRWQGGPV